MFFQIHLLPKYHSSPALIAIHSPAKIPLSPEPPRPRGRVHAQVRPDLKLSIRGGGRALRRGASGPLYAPNFAVEGQESGSLPPGQRGARAMRHTCARGPARSRKSRGRPLTWIRALNSRDAKFRGGAARQWRGNYAPLPIIGLIGGREKRGGLDASTLTGDIKTARDGVKSTRERSDSVPFDLRGLGDVGSCRCGGFAKFPVLLAGAFVVREAGSGRSAGMLLRDWGLQLGYAGEKIWVDTWRKMFDEKLLYFLLMKGLT